MATITVTCPVQASAYTYEVEGVITPTSADRAGVRTASITPPRPRPDTATIHPTPITPKPDTTTTSTPNSSTPTITGPSVWTPATWEGRTEEFIRNFTLDELRELTDAVDTFTAASAATPGGLSQALVHMDLHAFPLPTLGPKLRALAAEQLAGTSGRGFQLLRGLPVDALGQERALVAYMGVAATMGYNISPQRKDGKMVHHIKALHGAGGAGSRYAESTMSAAMGFHTDAQGDVLGLLCLRQAPEGGESRWVSAGAVHNEMLRRPGGRALVARMAAPGIWCRNKDRYQVIPAGEQPWWDMPVFDYTGGEFACHYAPVNHYTEAFAMYGAAGLGSMSEEQAAAIKMFEAIAGSEDFTMKLTMRDGDMMFLNNALVLHARSSFKDGERPEQRRHLVRLWMLDQQLAAQQQQQQQQQQQEEESKAAQPACTPATTRSSLTASADAPITSSQGRRIRQLPRHLDYPRDYSAAAGYSLATCREGLLRPDPATFFVPLVAEDPRN